MLPARPAPSQSSHRQGSPTSSDDLQPAVLLYKSVSVNVHRMLHDAATDASRDVAAAASTPSGSSPDDDDDHTGNNADLRASTNGRH